MRPIKKYVTILLAIVLIILCIIPSYALGDNENDSKNKITALLNEKMEDSQFADTIPVCLWYKDINQDNVERLTEDALGFTKGEIPQNIKMPSIEMLYNIRDNPDKKEQYVKDYLYETSYNRDIELQLTDRYISKRREISRSQYIEKSDIIINNIDIQDKDIIFRSRYAPMIVAELNRDTIQSITKMNDIVELDYYYEPEIQLCSDSSVPYTTNQYLLENNLGLTGEGIKIGVADAGVPTYNNLFDINDINIIGNGAPHGHANNTIAALVGYTTGFAKEAEIYASAYSINDIETLIDYNVVIINVSFGYKYYENTTNSDYAYNKFDRWADHIVAQHHVIFIASSGNHDPDEPNLKRVLSPAMGHNVITVSDYKDNDTSDDTTDDYYGVGIYKNNNNTPETMGVEKPDVIMPSSCLCEGTSTAAPLLTGLVAQILQLQPSLALHPDVVKAIVLASCHRKVKPASSVEPTETMTSGIPGRERTYSHSAITEQQGAGAPDAWTMAAIVSQKTYGTVEMGGNIAKICIEQPPYDAENMGVSLVWTKDNSIDEELNNEVTEATEETEATESIDTIIVDEGADYDLSLSVINGDECIAFSDLIYSTTEMCYFPLSDDNYRYLLWIDRLGVGTSTSLAYAWSTDTMGPENNVGEGLYFFHNKSSNRYASINSDAGSSYLKPKAVLVSDYDDLSDKNKWILNGSSSGYSLCNGYEYTDAYLNISNVLNNGGKTYADITSNPYTFDLYFNKDGSYSMISNDGSKILTYSGSSLVWDDFVGYNAILDTQKWYFDKSNYNVGDANADGYIDIIDVTFIQYYTLNYVTANNIQKYLGDFNGDGNCDILDANSLNLYLLLMN